MFVAAALEYGEAEHHARRHDVGVVEEAGGWYAAVAAEVDPGKVLGLPPPLTLRRTQSRTARPLLRSHRPASAQGEGQPWRTSSRRTGRCSASERVQASAIQPASMASATVHGEVARPATTSVKAVSSAR